jgi:hypothetical protein
MDPVEAGSHFAWLKQGVTIEIAVIFFNID